MLVSLIGTNGLLSGCVGLFCNQKGYHLNVYGRTAPQKHSYTQFIKTDLLSDNLDYAALAKSDIIIYAAGAGIQFHLKENSDSVYKLNVFVPVQICNHLKDLKFKGTFVTFGSYFEIGENLEDLAFTEIDILQTKLKAPNDYVISKRMLTRFFSSFQSTFTSLHFILPTIYGETESNYRLIPYTLRSINENQELRLTSGEQVRQYIYINDIAQLLFETIDSTIESGVYNVCGVEEFSVKQLVTKLFNLCNKELPENIFGKSQRIDTGMKILKLNGTKLSTKINFIPTTTIDQIYHKYIPESI